MQLPPSKSEVLRLILLAACHEKRCTICGDFSEPCDDILSMLEVAHGLGACWHIDSEGITINPGKPDGLAICDVGICATALRMSLSFFLLKRIPVRFLMKTILFSRCRESIESFLTQWEQPFLWKKEADDTVALELNAPLSQKTFEMQARDTSQLLSGLVLALTFVPGGAASVKVNGEIASKPYLELTLSLLRRYGCEIEWKGQSIWLRSGGFSLPERIVPEPDASAAVFPFVLAALGMQVSTAFPAVSSQADMEILHFLRSVHPASDPLPAFDMSFNANPDAAPLMALLASKANGISCLSGVGRLRQKECDRFSATMEILSAFGIRINSPDGESWRISGPSESHGGFSINGYGDHRMVMLITSASFLADAPVLLKGADCVRKSWPGFFDECARLGGKMIWQVE